MHFHIPGETSCDNRQPCPLGFEPDNAGYVPYHREKKQEMQ